MTAAAQIKPADIAMANALAQIQALSDATMARHALIEFDPRHRDLRIHRLSLEREVRDGFAGGMALFADVFSSAHKRRARIGKLMLARECQLMGRYHHALNALRDAAAIRCTEKLYRKAEVAASIPASELMGAE